MTENQDFYRDDAFTRNTKMLCRTIDELELEVEYWKGRYELEAKERAQEWKERLEQSKADLGQTLLLAFSLKEDGNGGLAISNEDRKALAENLKKQ